MELRRAPPHRASPTLDRARTAGIITLAGSGCAILGSVLPWLEKVAFGISLTNVGFQAGTVLIAILAVISASLAAFVLLRRPATPAVTIVLILLAVMQLVVATWDGAAILKAITQTTSHQVWASAIGTGLYASVLGPLIILAGGIVAWTGRASPGVPPPAANNEVLHR